MIKIIERKIIKASPVEDNENNYREYFKQVIPLVDNLEGSLVNAASVTVKLLIYLLTLC